MPAVFQAADVVGGDFYCGASGAAVLHRVSARTRTGGDGSDTTERAGLARHAGASQQSGSRLGYERPGELAAALPACAQQPACSLW